MWHQSGKLLVKGYVLLLTVAAGGLVGANVAGFVPAIGEFAANAPRAPDPKFVRSWVHGGWTVGAVLFFAGAVGQALRSGRKGHDAVERTAAARATQRSRPAPGRPKARDFRVTIGSRRCGILGSAGVGGLVGGFLGLMLGASLLLLWFSLAYSPFAPGGWASTVSLETIGHGTARPRKRALSTDHPVALYAFGGPIALGAFGGAVACGVGTAVEKWKARVREVPPR